MCYSKHVSPFWLDNGLEYFNITRHSFAGHIQKFHHSYKTDKRFLSRIIAIFARASPKDQFLNIYELHRNIVLSCHASQIYLEYSLIKWIYFRQPEQILKGLKNMLRFYLVYRSPKPVVDLADVVQNFHLLSTSWISVHTRSKTAIQVCKLYHCILKRRKLVCFYL